MVKLGPYYLFVDDAPAWWRHPRRPIPFGFTEEAQKELAGNRHVRRAKADPSYEVYKAPNTTPPWWYLHNGHDFGPFETEDAAWAAVVNSRESVHPPKPSYGVSSFATPKAAERETVEEGFLRLEKEVRESDKQVKALSDVNIDLNKEVRRLKEQVERQKKACSMAWMESKTKDQTMLIRLTPKDAKS